MIGSYRTRDEPPEVVEKYFREALSIFAAARDQSGILLLLGAYSVLASRAGQADRFHQLGGAIERLREETGAGLADVPVAFIDYSLPERPVGDPDAMLRWEEGRRLSTEEAIRFALGDDGASDR